MRNIYLSELNDSDFEDLKVFFEPEALPVQEGVLFEDGTIYAKVEDPCPWGELPAEDVEYYFSKYRGQ